MSSNVDIGFINDCSPEKLASHMFPSKVGGRPAWLELKHMPTAEDLRCNLCKRQLVFLCQLYAPYEEDDNNFHRTLFVFVCRNAACCQPNNSDNMKVFRSHLMRENAFYSREPARGPYEFVSYCRVPLCRLCGCPAERHCGKCRVPYCCREHQVMDWKENHKGSCGTFDNGAFTENSKLLFREYEIITEPEPYQEHVVDEQRQLQEFEQLRQEGKTEMMPDCSEADLQAYCKVVVDKTFLGFKKRISENPEQVVRYERGGTPLWIAKEPRPEVIPDCEYCGGPRQFEFQVMPQMLSMLQEYSLDWGMLIVYTCKRSCTTSTGYKKEFIFKQDVTND